MPLPVIPGSSIYVIPAVPAVAAVEYPNSALVGLQLITPPGSTDLSKQTIQVTFSPYNQAAGQLPPQMPFAGPGTPQVPLERLAPINVWAEATRSTLFASALSSIVGYATLAVQESRLKQQIAALKKAGVDTTALAAQLVTIQTEMGVSQ